MEITLESVELEGFRSFRERQTITFPQGDSLVLVSGVWKGSSVSSGSGKSSILEALAFSFDISESSQASLKNWDSKKMFVKTTLRKGDDHIEVIRDPKLSLVINGEPWNSLVKGAKEKLAEILGVSDEMLKSITYRKQRVRGQLVKSTDSQIKEFLSQPLGLNEIETAAESFATASNKTTGEIELIKRDISNLEMTLNMSAVTEQHETDARAALEKARASAVSADSNIQTAQEAYRVACAGIHPAQKSYDESREKVNSLSGDSSRQELLSQASFLKNEISKTSSLAYEIEGKRRDNASLKTQIVQLQEEIGNLSKGVCPTCSREWDKMADLKESKQKLFDSKVLLLQSNVEYIKNAEPIVKELPALTQRLEDVNRKLGEANAPVEMASRAMAAAETALRAARTSAESANQNVEFAKTSYSAALRAISVAEQNLAQLDDRRKNHDTVLKKLSDAKNSLAEKEREIEVNSLAAKLLGRSGFLGSIFDEILSDIEARTNDMLSHYPNAGQFTVQINSTKAVKSKGTLKKEITVSISRNGTEIPSIDDISGGQQAAIELCSDLAAAEAIRARSGCAIKWICLDEVMDGLGPAEKEAVVNMLRQRVKGLVLMIEHATEIKESFDQVISVEFDGKDSNVVAS